MDGDLLRRLRAERDPLPADDGPARARRLEAERVSRPARPQSISDLIRRTVASIAQAATSPLFRKDEQ